MEICGKRLVHRLKEGFFPLFGDKHNIVVTITNTYFPRLGKKYLDVNSLHICKFVWPRTIFTWEFPSAMRINVSTCTTARNWNVKGLNWEGGKVVTFFMLFISLWKNAFDKEMCSAIQCWEPLKRCWVFFPNSYRSQSSWQKLAHSSPVSQRSL